MGDFNLNYAPHQPLMESELTQIQSWGYHSLLAERMHQEKLDIVTFPRSKSCIDHILTNVPPHLVCSGGIGTSIFWGMPDLPGYTDHRPMWIGIRSCPRRQDDPNEHSQKQMAMVYIRSSDHAARAAIQASISKWFNGKKPASQLTTEQACSELEDMTHTTVQIARLQVGKPQPVPLNRKGPLFRHDWSPEHMKSVYHLSFLERLLPKRQVLESSLLSSFRSQASLDVELRRYEQAIADLDRRYPAAELTVASPALDRLPPWWHENYAGIDFATLLEDIQNLKHSMHSRHRRRKSMSMCNAVSSWQRRAGSQMSSQACWTSRRFYGIHRSCKW